MTKRDQILDAVITRMKQINGLGNFVFNLANRVEFAPERPDITKYKSFVEYPTMFVTVASIDPEYWFGGIVKEKISLKLITAFNAVLSKAQMMDFISDVFFAHGDDLKLGGLVDFAVLGGPVVGETLEEENLTELIVPMEIEFRRLKSER